MSGDLRWHDMLHEYYGVFMGKGRPDIWLKLIREPDGCGCHTTESEIVEAIKWVREKLRYDDDGGKKQVTLDTLIMWIRWRRKELRKATEPEEDLTCHICNKGWITVWLALPENPAVADFSCRSQEVTAPCVCKAGRALLATCKDYAMLSEKARDEVTEMARLGVRQNQLRMLTLEKETRDMMAMKEEGIPEHMMDGPQEEPVEEGVPF